MTGHLNGMGGSLTVKLVTTAGVASDKRKRRNEGDDDDIINIVGGGGGERIGRCYWMLGWFGSCK